MMLFDSHNHVQLGPRGVDPLLETLDTLDAASSSGSGAYRFSGCSVMSTHPRDFTAVDTIVAELHRRSFRAVPCYGIHPWFLNELLVSSAEESGGGASVSSDDEWLVDLRRRLVDNKDSIVGEIGLDGARWTEVVGDDCREGEHSGESIWKRERVLACPMDLQRRAFEEQMLIAAELSRPVSIHVVRAWGELFDSLDYVREVMRRRYLDSELGDEPWSSEQSKRIRKKVARRRLLPPKIYFHAFSGKLGVIPSLLAACAKGNIPRKDVYFGFAPVSSCVGTCNKTFRPVSSNSISWLLGNTELLRGQDSGDYEAHRH